MPIMQTTEQIDIKIQFLCLILFLFFVCMYTCIYDAKHQTINQSVNQSSPDTRSGKDAIIAVKGCLI